MMFFYLQLVLFMIVFILYIYCIGDASQQNNEAGILGYLNAALCVLGWTQSTITGFISSV